MLSEFVALLSWVDVKIPTCLASVPPVTEYEDALLGGAAVFAASRTAFAA